MERLESEKQRTLAVLSIPEGKKDLSAGAGKGRTEGGENTPLAAALHTSDNSLLLWSLAFVMC